jgi:hypothetical protein
MSKKNGFIAAQIIGAAALVLAATTGLTYTDAPANVASKSVPVTYINVAEVRKAIAAGQPAPSAHTVFTTVLSPGNSQLLTANDIENTGGGLPLWTFKYRAARDGLKHLGAMVGTNPFTNPQSTSVPANVVPLVLKIHSIVTAIDPNTGAFTTKAGSYIENPLHPDNVCLQKPNNVPATLLLQSPLFQRTSITLGGTNFGKTQYIDAFQRANFINANPEVASSYHLLLSPARLLEPVVIDVPALAGVALDSSLLPATFGGPPACGTLTFIDIAWFDSYLNDQVLPALADQGVAPSNLPVFIFYNTVEGVPQAGIFACCDLGYHSYGGFPTPTQTYSVTEFDSTKLFIGGPNNSTAGFSDTAITSHEIGEWANDPFGINLVPAWGGTGQVAGCQGNLEVGDPLTGTTLPPIKMPNGFSYNLQELTFFSWFFGGPSLGVNGWYSDNGTFATDAGTPCQLE